METSPKALTESPKETDPDRKTLEKESFKGSLAENCKENGDGLSKNVKEEAFDKKILEEGLEDSEMNGVCSLLKMQGSENLKGLGSVLDFLDQNKKSGQGDGVDITQSRDLGETVNGVETSIVNEEFPDGDFGDMGYDGHEFNVGDFVWGKIRSHPWWPGRIYDHLDASDYAKKVKQRDKILVAYFGDGTFAWCLPSQLKPFEEDFEMMSKQSSSKNFVNAVKEALNEVGRLVDLKMTCSCVPKDNLMSFGRTLAVNAGIKDGLLVPEHGIEKFSPALFEPAEFIPALKTVAQVAAVSNMLEFSVLKNWLAAFYRSRGGYQLPTYHEPQPIRGLDDGSRNWVANFTSYSSGMEVTMQGPVEDWSSSPGGSKVGHTTESFLQKCHGLSEDRRVHRRKQKSIAELLGTQTNAEAGKEEDNVPNEETKSRQLASSAGKKAKKGTGGNTVQDIERDGDNEGEGVTKDGVNSKESALSSAKKKRKGTDEPDGVAKGKVGDVAKAGLISDELPSQSGRKKRKVRDEAIGGSENKSDDIAKAGASSDKPASSSKGRKRKVSNGANADDDNDLISLQKMRRQMKLSDSTDNSVVKNGTMSVGRQEKNSMEDDHRAGIEEGMRDNRVSGEKEPEKISLSRDRKKSKYLSPPYTNLIRGARNKETEVEPQIASSEAKLEERKTEADPSDNSSALRPKQDENIIYPKEVNVPAEELLSQIRSAALDPTCLTRDNSLNIVDNFVSAFRNSICVDGSNYKTKQQYGKRRKLQDSEPRPLVKKQHCLPTDHRSSSTKIRKSEEAKLDRHKGKQAAKAQSLKTSGDHSDEKVRGAVLCVTFNQGAPLPSKNDLIKIYGKFGALNAEETNINYNTHRAAIVYLRSTEAEEAFNDSQLVSPFGTANATFQLQYLSAESKTPDPELVQITSSKLSPLAEEGAKTPDRQAASKSPSTNVDVSHLSYIRQKLELMTSMLETSEGTISPRIKSKLEGEMKCLLEKVNTMVGSLP